MAREVEELSLAMKSIILEEEEEGGIAIDENNRGAEEDVFTGNVKLCLVGRFLNEGIMDVTAMKQTLALLWRPGRGVYIKEVDPNLFIF